MKIEKDPNHEELDDELQSCLKEILSKVEDEDSWVRKQQVKFWKKCDEFWHGVQFIFWSESRQDWLSPTESRFFQESEPREEAEGPFYDFVLNIYKAHGESIIAALAAQIPGIRFPPDDADDEDDLMTARTYDKIVDLIQRHNKCKILLLKALFILWNQGIVCAYHAPKADKAFGEVKLPRYKEGYVCPKCEHQHHKEAGKDCPKCSETMDENNILDGFDESPKSRVLIDVYGPLHVKVPYNSKEQADFGYILLARDLPKAYLKNIYPHCKEEIDNDLSDTQMFEKINRQPSSFSSTGRVDENRQLTTLKQMWIRPWMFEMISDDRKEQREKLQELFPTGCYAAFIGKKYVEARDEDMDKHWSIGKAGLSQFIHSDPMGQSLLPVQEIKNVLTNITLETIEQGIPSTFADPEVVDFTTYSKHEQRPGQVYPAKKRPGESMGDAFYESGRATLSSEVPGFSQELDKSGQFLVGSFPSIYGGTNDSKSRTAAEYNMSRQMALQRLSITWALITDWWADMFKRCVQLFVENMIEDERYVVKNDNNYVNVWIRRSEMSGKVGDIEVEGSESFPTSMAQKQALFMKLLEMKDEAIHAMMLDPANRKTFADLLGFPELEIPGESQRIKQARETGQMVKTGQPIQINPDVDDHEIHMFTIRGFLVGDIGMDLQEKNPQVYQILLQHLKDHEAADQKNKDAAMQKQIQNQMLIEEQRANNSMKREKMKIMMKGQNNGGQPTA